MKTPIFLHISFCPRSRLTCVEITSMKNYRSEEKRTSDHSSRDNSGNRCCPRDSVVNTICPSKLSKNELEELYFALIENNLELKRRVNTQDDQLRQLNTKIQRMTATQKAYTGHNGAGGGGKETCCEGYKAMIDEQKHVISEIQTANEKLTERIKQLNMQLDSTKQFLKKPPSAQQNKTGGRPGTVRPQSANKSANQDKPRHAASVDSKTTSPRTPASPKTQPKPVTPTKDKTPTRDTKDWKPSTPTRDRRMTSISSRGATPTRDSKQGTQTSPRDRQSRTHMSPRDTHSKSQASSKHVTPSAKTFTIDEQSDPQPSASDVPAIRPGSTIKSTEQWKKRQELKAKEYERGVQPSTQAFARDIQHDMQISGRDVQPGAQTYARDVQPGTETFARDVQSGKEISTRNVQPAMQTSGRDVRPGMQTSGRDIQPGIQISGRDVQPGTQTYARDEQPETQAFERDVLPEIQTSGRDVRPGTQTSRRDVQSGTQPYARDIQPGIQTFARDVLPGTQTSIRDVQPIQTSGRGVEQITPCCATKSTEQWKKCQEMRAKETKSTSTPEAPMAKEASTSMPDSKKSGPETEVHVKKKTVECQCDGDDNKMVPEYKSKNEVAPKDKSKSEVAPEDKSKRKTSPEDKSKRKMSSEDNSKRKMAPEKLCDENRCSTEMEELKLKIVYLQEELSKTHKEYLSRITRLEREILQVRAANMRAVSDQATRETVIRQRDENYRAKDAKLRGEEKNSAELAMQLEIERSKVAELITQLKAASVTAQVAKTLEEHLFTPTTQTYARPSEDPIIIEPENYAEPLDNRQITQPENYVKPLENPQITQPENYGKPLDKRQITQPENYSKPLDNRQITQPEDYAKPLEDRQIIQPQNYSTPQEDALIAANKKLLKEHLMQNASTGTDIKADTSTTTELMGECGCGEVCCGYEDKGVCTKDVNEQQNHPRDVPPSPEPPTTPKPKRKHQNAQQIERSKRKSLDGQQLAPISTITQRKSIDGQQIEPLVTKTMRKSKDDSQSIKSMNREGKANALNNKISLDQLKESEDFESSDAINAEDYVPVSDYYIISPRKVDDHDSGFADPKIVDSDEETARQLAKIDLIRRIHELQNQLVNLKESASIRTQTQSASSPLHECSYSEETYNVDLTGGEYPGVDSRKKKVDKADSDRSKSLNEANRRWVNYDRPSGPAGEPIINAQPPDGDENQNQNRRPSKSSYENQRYQIPGPIPTECNTKGERCNKNTPPSQIPRTSIISSRERRHSNSSEVEPASPTRRDSVRITKERSLGKKENESIHSTGVDYDDLMDNPAKGLSFASDVSTESKSNSDKTRPSIQPSASLDMTRYVEKPLTLTNLNITPYTDNQRPSIEPSTSLEINPFRTENEAKQRKTIFTEEEASTSKTADKSRRRNSLEIPPPSFSPTRASSKGPKTVGNQTSSLGEKRDAAVSSDVVGPELDICEHYAHVCRCPRATRRDVAVFRSCSGTLCFRTTDIPNSTFRKCRCGKTDEIATGAQPNLTNHLGTSQVDDKSMISQKPVCSNSCTGIERPGINIPIKPRELSSRRNSPAKLIDDRVNTTEPRRDFKEELIIPERIKRLSTVERNSPELETFSKVDRNSPKVIRRVSQQSDRVEPMVEPETNAEYSQARRRSRRSSVHRLNETQSRHTSPLRRDSNSKEAPVQFCLMSQTPKFIKSNAAQTYIVRGSAEVIRCGRATSPGDNYNNTDREISSMTDLPSERDMPWTPRSPGEDKATTMISYTDSYTTPTPPTPNVRYVPTEYNTFSEGEVPQDRATRLMNFAEIQVKDNISDGEHPLRETSSQKMELALQAIGEELALCRRLLLQTQRPSEQPPKPQTRDASCPSPHIALHRAEPQTTLGDAFTPRCLFVLHIGTVVLSDEAVMASRNLSLIMMWQFYDQNVAMTHMRTGRVMHFDFATEYDVKLTDNFLDYLKYEEMQIKICEINKQKEPFATCSLPLRDALLHTNRRADVSLALISGPSMQHLENSDESWDSGDEVGVLDLWCMLRAEPRLLPRISKSMAGVGSDFRGSNSVRPSTGGLAMEQIDEDDQDDNPSTDIDLMLPASKPPKYDDYLKPERYPRRQSMANAKKPSMFHRDSNVKSLVYIPRIGGEKDVESMSRGGEALEPANPSTSSGGDLGNNTTDKTGVSFNNRSDSRMSYDRRISTGFLINEVPTSIRSTGEMKSALEKGIKETYISPKVQVKDDKTLGRRHPKQRLSLTSLAIPDQQHKKSIAGIQSMLRQGEPEQHRQAEAPENDDASVNTVLSQRYDNVVKLLNSKRGQKPLPDALKKVKIDNEKLLAKRPSEDGTTLTQEPKVNRQGKTIDITVMWLALNEECDLMNDPNVQRLYVAYTFLGYSGAELETPISLPKPKQCTEKCYFNFKKTFHLTESELAAVGRMAKRRSPSRALTSKGRRECVTFSVVSEPQEDPLGINNCEDVGHAYLYFGDLLQYSAGNDSYIEVLPVQGHSPDDVCGVLAVRVDGLNLVRKCLMMAPMPADTWRNSF